MDLTKEQQLMIGLTLPATVIMRALVEKGVLSPQDLHRAATQTLDEIPQGLRTARIAAPLESVMEMLNAMMNPDPTRPPRSPDWLRGVVQGGREET